MTEITIRMSKDEDYIVDAEIVGQWAIHNALDQNHRTISDVYSLTHVKTGLLLLFFASRDDAIAAAHFLAPHNFDYYGEVLLTTGVTLEMIKPTLRQLVTEYRGCRNVEELRIVREQR